MTLDDARAIQGYLVAARSRIGQITLGRLAPSLVNAMAQIIRIGQQGA